MSWREKIKSLLQNLRYIKQERGAIFVLTALLLPVLFGFMGFAYDVGNLYMHKARLQNVTDAAALAGGGLFKNPPEKAEPTEADEYISATSGKVVKLVNNVEVVVKEIQNVDYKDGTTIKDRKGGTTVTTNSPNHVKADLEAKRYIERNAVNLGNLITTEELSALAYNDSKTTKVNGTPTTSGNVTTTVNTETTKVTDAKFYRVIASEEVPLYFLPVILGENKRTQTVRTTSVAMLDNTSENTKTTTTKVTGGSNNPTPTTKTILDTLFTFVTGMDVTDTMNNYDANALSQNSANLGSTYKGDIYYTTDNASFAGSHQGYYLYKTIYFNQDAKGQDVKALNLIDQYGYFAKKDTAIDVEAYKDIFTNKFNTDSKVVLNDKDFNSSVVRNASSNIFVYNGYANNGIVIDGSFSNGDSDVNTPVYILFNEKKPDGGDRDTISVVVDSDNVRPIVLVFTGGSSTWSPNIVFSKKDGGNGGTFRGVIYAPYSNIQFHASNVNFEGNVIAKSLEIKTGGTANFEQKNFLKNEEGFQNLPTLNTSSSSGITQQQFNNGMKEALQYLATYGTDEERSWTDKKYFEWVYNKLNDENFDMSKILEGLHNTNDTDIGPSQTSIYKAWQGAFDYATRTLLPSQYTNFQLADLNNISKVPWDGYTPSGNTGGTTQPTTEVIPSTPVITNSSQFRLINPRTETNPYFAPDSDI